MTYTKRIASIILMAVGMIAIFLSIGAFTLDIGYGSWNEAYGGDAYTGIQNAAAQTSRNVVYVTEAIAYVGGAILLIGGLALIGGGLAVWPKSEEEKFDYAVTGSAMPENQQAFYGVMPMAQPVRPNTEMPYAEPVRTPNGWRCACGREHPAYVSSCYCGINKSAIQ